MIRFLKPRRALAACCALALMAGCGTDAERGGLFNIGQKTLGAVRGVGSDRGVLGAQNLSLSDARLRAYGQPVLKVTRARQGVSAGLIKQDDKGAPVIWRSTDGKTITLFNGLLISTKGFGNDLSSARVPTVQPGETDVLREHYYLGGDEVIRRFAYFCDFRAGGAPTINLVGVSVATTLVVETCSGEKDTFENRYWFNNSGGIVKSSQWVGPETGPLIIEFVPRTTTSTTRVAATSAAVTSVQGSDGVVVISGSVE
ncbi:YjbF family lipoprotein [Oceaniglobus ichthyenteri]|uniref:YjbF family lipoprotein n=1 Tax=Oceaniglobus ichthyenteri TaxID=2136177 RepID=UPI000D386A46|nr:YjbF family lipoprotein [Oceaniglobus ichthyenteri]